MNHNARIQAWATAVAVLSLPMLYIGATHDVFALSVIGLVIFTLSLLVCPALRFRRPRGKADDTT